MSSFSIVIPTYNERENIINLIIEIQKEVKDCNYNLIIVDDNSPDKTSEVIKTYVNENSLKNIICINRSWQKGLSSAVVEGIASSSSEFVIVMDGDGQHDPKDILKLINTQRDQNSDIVIGSRFHNKNSNIMLSRNRSLLSKLGIKVSRLFIDGKYTDPLTGFFLIKREVIQTIQKEIYKDGFKILFDILMLKKDIQSHEIQINFRARNAGDSKLNISTTAHLLGQIVENLTHKLIPSTFFVFSLIGSMGAVIHLLILLALLKMGVGYIVSNIFGSSIALTANYFLNNYLTFNNLHNSFKSRLIGLLKYALFNSLSLMTNIGVASFLYLDNFSIAISTIFGIVAGLLLNYFLSRNIVFRS
jgi:dolichol-phosphate mannosyltransferase